MIWKTSCGEMYVCMYIYIYIYIIEALLLTFQALGHEIPAVFKES